MRANEIIRDLLDLIDAIDGNIETPSTDLVIEPEIPADAEINRFKQIAGLLDVLPDCAAFENQPNEVYLGIAAVTTNAGGGINGPKDIADVRVNNPSLYSSQQRS